MTFEGFVEKLIDSNIDVDLDFGEVLEWYTSFGYPRKVKKPGEPALVNRWEIGGARGGNCWGDKAYEYTNEESPPTWTSLHDALRVMCPQISYLQFLDLSAQHVKEDTESGGEYYGNYRIYKVNFLLLKDLYEFLIENNLLELS